MDVHRDFCEVAIWDAGEVVRAPRVASRPEQLQAFAAQLLPTDRVAMEATGNALTIARIVGPHVAAVEIVNTRRLKAITESRQKTDRHDAKTLAQLLAVGMFAGSWQPDEQTRMLRRLVARRARLVTHRTLSKNEVLEVLHRNLKPRPPMSDPFGVAGRAWLTRQELPVDEQDTINAALRQIDFLNEEIQTIEAELARFATASASAEAKQLMTVPGVGLVTATAFLAQVGEITRFPNPNRLVSYLGLNPSVRQSGDHDAHTGGSQRKAPRSSGTSSSRPPRLRSAAPALCERSSSASAPAAVTPSRSSPWHGSWRCSSGTCSSAAKTTPTRCQPRPPRSSEQSR